MENQLAVAKMCRKEYRGELIQLLQVRKEEATKKSNTQKVQFHACRRLFVITSNDTET
jgi:hypothetical protein